MSLNPAQPKSVHEQSDQSPLGVPDITVDILVIGAGSAGIGVVASLLKRVPDLRITLIELNEQHHYQPAWTLVGGGAYDVRKTARPMSQVIPRGATWIKAAVVEVLPDSKRLKLSNGQSVAYQNLIVCPGLRLAWEKIEGLEEYLGKHGVTSNYRYDLCAYTWQLVQGLRCGKALFSQPAMPIKCAGAPQKALYLSCDHWQKSGVLQDVDVEFNLAGVTLFGAAAFVPPLMKYIDKYQAQLVFGSNLVKVDGPGKTAWFESRDEHGTLSRHAKRFDMLHVVPPQVAPDFIRLSPLADAAGWCEVDPGTLQHSRYPEVFALGDICSTSNDKTAAAARKQIVVVAENLLAVRRHQPMPLCYDGYGSCPLTVEKGKVVLAEFGYGGKLLPSFPLEPHWQHKNCMLNPQTGRLRWTLECSTTLTIVGSVSGLLTGMLGLGGGFLIVPAFQQPTDIRMHGIVATSLMAIALISASAVAGAFVRLCPHHRDRRHVYRRQCGRYATGQNPLPEGARQSHSTGLLRRVRCGCQLPDAQNLDVESIPGLALFNPLERSSVEPQPGLVLAASHLFPKAGMRLLEFLLIHCRIPPFLIE